MSDASPSNPSASLPQSLLEQIDAACDRFEVAWRLGGEPKIEEFLVQSPEAGRGELFYQLLLVDLHWRGKRQESPTPDDYTRRFPGFCRQIEAAFAHQLPSPAGRGAGGEGNVLPSPVLGRGAGGEGNAASPAADSNHTGPESTVGRRQGLHLRCPHCHNAVEVVLDESSDSIACPSCGQTFAPDAGATEGWTPAAETPTPQPRTLGHLQLLEKVGEGAFGAVWKARDTKLDRIVAVKIPRRGQLEAEEVEKFLREARAAAQLKHPNIVGVHEVGQHGDTVFIVSDFIDGPTLAQRLKERLPDEREAAALCRKIALALDYAHSKGVIHRDLKPGNVMIDAAGEPYIMDFGLAKRQGGEITMTVEGSILGTPAYMSPEQARGEGNKADARSDVYSLGVMLFEFLTGERPFRGETMMLLMQVIEDDPPPVRRLNSRISRDLETIVAKCLEKPPAKRYATAGDLAEDLGRFLRGEPTRARPVGRAEWLWRWCRRNPVVAGLVSVAALLLVTVAIVSTAAYVREAQLKLLADQKTQEALQAEAKTRQQELKAEQEAQNAKAARNIAEAEKDLADSQLRRSQRLLYVSRITSAERAWSAGDVEEAWQSLDACCADLRGWEHSYLHTLFTKNQRTLEARAAEVPLVSMALSRDGKRIVCGGFNGTAKLLDALTGEEILTWKGHTGLVRAVVFNPDGTRVASGGIDTTLRVWNVANGQEVLTLRGHGGGVNAVAFSPDGTRIVSGSTDGTLKLWDVGRGQKVGSFIGHTSGVLSVAFSPDGKRVVSGSGDGTLEMWDLTSNNVVWTSEETTAGTGAEMFGISALERRLMSAPLPDLSIFRQYTGVLSVAFSPDGNWIASGSSDGTLKLWEATNGKAAFGIRGHGSKVWSVAFSPDGKRIASGSEDKTLKVWDSSRRREIRSLKGHFGSVMNVAFSPDGKQIVSASDRELKVWDATRDRGPVSLSHGDGRISVAFSPDSKRIVSGSTDGTLKLWDVRTGQELVSFEEHTDEVSSVAFSPDGKRIVSGSADGTLKLWDPASSDTISTLKGHTAGVKSVAFSPDGKRIVSGGDDGTLRLWDAGTGVETVTLRGEFESVCSVAFSADGKRIASVCYVPFNVVLTLAGEAMPAKKTIPVAPPPPASLFSNQPVFSPVPWLILWDATSGQRIATIRDALPSANVAFRPDGRRIVSGGGSLLKIWDMGTLRVILTLERPGHSVSRVRYSPDGNRIVSGFDDGTVIVWDAETGQEMLTIKEHSSAVSDLAFSPDGKWLASGSEDGTLTLWDGTIAQRTLTLAGQFDPVIGVAISPNGRQIVGWTCRNCLKTWDVRSGLEMRRFTGHVGSVVVVAFGLGGSRVVCGGSDGTAKLWDASTGEEMLTLKGHAGPVCAVAVNPDGTRVATGSTDETLRVWNVANGQEVLTLRGHTDGVRSVAFSSNGKRIVSGSGDGTLKMWDLTSNNVIATVKGHAAAVSSLAFSPDGKRIVSKSDDGTLKLWDPASNNAISALKGHTAGVSNVTCGGASVAFSPDGKWIVSGGWDNALRVWDAASGREAFTLKGHLGMVTDVAFSPDGKHIVSGSVDGTIRVWDATGGE